MPHPHCLLVSVLSVLLLAPVSGAQTLSWKQSGQDGFSDGKRESMVLTSQGDLRLGRLLTPLVADDDTAKLISAVAEAPDKTLVYATSLPARVFVLKPGDKEPTLLADLGENALPTALLFRKDASLLVAVSGESAKLLHFPDLSAKPRDIPLPEGTVYVWALGESPEGKALIATGPDGVLYSLADGADKPELVVDLDEDNLLSLAVSREGSIYIGTDPRGRVYRLDPGQQRPSVVFDASEPEISALALDAAGHLLIAASAVAEESESPDSPHAGSRGDGLPDANAPLGLPGSPAAPGFPEPPAIPGKPPAPEPREPGASLFSSGAPVFSISVPSADAPGESESEETATGSAVYRLDPDGFPSELLRTPHSILCMAVADGVVLVGTAGDGSLLQVDVARDDVAEIARVDAADITALLPLAGKTVLVATGNGASLSVLSASTAAEGTFTSSVLTASHVARLGTLRLDGTLPPGSTATVSCRSGNTAEPSEQDWSPWSTPVPAERFVKPVLPPGRYAQFRLSFTPGAQGESPVLREIEWAYRIPNLAPRITSLSAGGAETEEAEPPTGPAAAPPLKLTWEAEDPNGDTLHYTLEYRPVGETDWRPLRNDVKEPSFDWNTREVPEGRYQVRVLADDAPSNPDGESKKSARVSGVLLVDHKAPTFSKPDVTPTPEGVVVKLAVQDSTSAVVKVSFRVNAEAEWRNADAGDKLFDSPSEDVTVLLRDLVAGRNVVHFRALDSSGNEGFETLVVERAAGK